MLRAGKAKRKTQRSIEKQLKQKLNYIKIDIKNAIKFGCFSITRYGMLDYKTKQKLEELGYTVDVTESKYENEYSYCIKWQ